MPFLNTVTVHFSVPFIGESKTSGISLGERTRTQGRTCDILLNVISSQSFLYITKKVYSDVMYKLEKVAISPFKVDAM